MNYDIGPMMKADRVVLVNGVEPFPGGIWRTVSVSYQLEEEKNRTLALADLLNLLRGSFSTMGELGEPNSPDPLKHKLYVLKGEWMRETVVENKVWIDCTYAFRKERQEQDA